MRAPLYLMLLCCIKIHPSMPIFNVSSRSFSVAEGCCRAWRLSLGSCDHTIALQKAFCLVPRGAHSAYSCIITSKWLQESMEHCHCRGHFPKPRIITVNIPVQLACTRFCKHSATYSAHYKSLTHLYSSNLLPWGLLVPHAVIGSVKLRVFAAFYEALEMSVRMYPSVRPTAFFMRFCVSDNDWGPRL